MGYANLARAYVGRLRESCYPRGRRESAWTPTLEAADPYALLWYMANHSPASDPLVSPQLEKRAAYYREVVVSSSDDDSDTERKRKKQKMSAGKAKEKGRKLARKTASATE